MWRFGWHLETIAWLQRASRLALYCEVDPAFEEIAGFDPRMRVPRNERCGFYFYFRDNRHITWHWTIHLRQYLSRQARRRCGRRTLPRRAGRNEPRSRTDRAGRKASSCQHDNPPPNRQRPNLGRSTSVSPSQPRRGSILHWRGSSQVLAAARDFGWPEVGCGSFASLRRAARVRGMSA